MKEAKAKLNSNYKLFIQTHLNFKVGVEGWRTRGLNQDLGKFEKINEKGEKNLVEFNKA